MTTRLVALVMLPVTVMCVLAGSVVMSHRATASRAMAVDHGVVELSELVALHDSLSSLWSLEAFKVRFIQLGVSAKDATTFIGFDWTTQVGPARLQAAQAIASLGSRSPVAAATLTDLYVGIDRGSISPKVAAQRLADLADRGGLAVTSGLDRLEVEVRDGPLVAALESLRATRVLAESATPQVVDLSAVWFPSPADTPATGAAALARLANESSVYSTGVNRVHALGVPTVVGGLTSIEADPQVETFEQAVAASLRGEPLTKAGAQLDTVRVATAFRGHFTRDEMLDGLVRTATKAVRSEARNLAASERTGFMAWAAGAVALAVMSIIVALRLAHSISRPLKDLADYAHAVNEGQLDVELKPNRDHGPRETRVAFSVFTDLVANLQLLDAKANALAECDFDDPVLLEPLPGRLGRSLESSVAVLSGSIVERDKLQSHLAHQATHDSLTGISNRPAAIAAIEAAMHRSARTGATTALLFIDLNEFKAVNDSHGHEVGDAVLRQVAERMTSGLRSGDFVARLGGDEFIVVAEGITDVADATALARHLIDAISLPIEVGGLHITIGAAVGIAMTLDGPEDPLRLLARADGAMYRAKQHKRSAIEIFDADLQQQMVEREDVETALTAALIASDGGGLQLHYQPVLDGRTGAMVGAEALIRWDRPGHGMLPPDSFIPIAEATALIIAVDRWVLGEAMRQLVEWSSDASLADVPVSVNISGRHLLSRHLPEHIRVALDESGVDPRRLIIEITETVLLTDLVGAAAELDEVRALGVRVAIDDFGTGYTSLAHLQQLPIDTIKIDRSFMSQLNVKRGNSLVRMVTDLGHAIDINIVAEGVETAAELQALQAMGADHLQGYLLSRPLTALGLSAWALAHDDAECRALAPVA